MKKTPKTKPIPFKITPQGSLGVLALGDVGVSAWRKSKQQNEEKPKD